MVLKLNVLVTISKESRIFSVWADNEVATPNIDIYEGHGFRLFDAIEDLYDNLPEIIFIDDEIQVNKKAVFYSLKRPFTILQQCCSN